MCLQTVSYETIKCLSLLRFISQLTLRNLTTFKSPLKYIHGKRRSLDVTQIEVQRRLS